jgi:protein TonB
MLRPDQEKRDRLKSALAVALFHALLGYAFITGLRFDAARHTGERMKLFDIREEPPPPPPPPPQAPGKRRERTAAPPDLRSSPAEIVAPPPKVRLDTRPPVVTAAFAGQGSEATTGAAEMVGPGTGSGGRGNGLGGGGAGTGSRAVRESGRLLDQDYPRAAKRARAEGVVAVRFVVETDGRVGECAVLRSSGNDDLDSTTCRLIRKRFRYRPATDPAGHPVRDSVSSTFEWRLTTDGS